MTTGVITNRLLDPSGNPLSGVVVNARLMPNPSGFRTSSFYEISQLATTTSDGNGDWQLVLEQNATINPGDSYWEIVENIPATAGPQRVWSIQVGAGTNTLYASLVSTPPYQPVPSYITQSSGDARYAPFSGLTLGSVQAVGTATQTGTATTAAASNHIHPLNPSVVGTGLTLTSGVIQVASGYAFTRTTTNTATASLTLGQFVFSSTSAAVSLFTGSVRVTTTPQSATVATSESTTSTSYTDLATAGPSVTLLTGTSVLVYLTARQMITSGGSGAMSVAISGATTVAASDTVAATSNVSGLDSRFGAAALITGLTPGLNTFTAKYKNAGGAGLTCADRNIIVQAVP